jgi:hypothetical protein
MTEIKTRGYVIAAHVGFALHHYDADVAAKIAASLPETIRDPAKIDVVEWFPREYSIRVLRAIAAVKNDPVLSYEDLVKCGHYTCEIATSTYLKLLLRILTPKIWASKVTHYFKRDMSRGHVTVDSSAVDKNRLVVHLEDIEGFDHLGPVSAGFLQRSIQSLGKKDVTVTQEGYSFEKPGPEAVHFTLAWS